MPLQYDKTKYRAIRDIKKPTTPKPVAGRPAPRAPIRTGPKGGRIAPKTSYGKPPTPSAYTQQKLPQVKLPEKKKPDKQEFYLPGFLAKPLGIKQGGKYGNAEGPAGLFPNIASILEPFQTASQNKYAQGGTAAEQQQTFAKAGVNLSQEQIKNPLEMLKAAAANPFKVIPAAFENAGKVYGSPAGAPEAIMRAVSAPSEITKRVIGTGLQATGIPSLQAAQPLLSAAGSPGGIFSAMGQLLGEAGLAQVAPFVKKAATGALQNIAAALEGTGNPADATFAQYARDAVTELNGSDRVTAGGVTQLVANAKIRAEQAGVDTTPMDTLLPILVPDKATRDQVEELQKQTIETGGISSGQDIANAFQASSVSYMAPELVNDLRARLDSGEALDTATTEVLKRAKPADLLRDAVYTGLFDPLNALELVQAPKMLRDIRHEQVARLLVPAADKLETVKPVLFGLDEFISRASQFSTANKLPDIAWLFRPTEHTLIKRQTEEAGQMLMDLFGTVKRNPDAVANLNRLGITESPQLTLMKVFLDGGDDAAEFIAKGPTVGEVRAALGVGADSIKSASEAKLLGVPVGTALDRFSSVAGQNTRLILNNMPAPELDNIVKLYGDSKSAVADGLEALVARDKLRKASDLIPYAKDAELHKMYEELVSDPVISMLETLDGATKKAMGIVDKEPGLLGKAAGGLGNELKGLQSFVAGFQLSPLNPGHATRNLVTNKVAMWARGVDIMASGGSLRAWAAKNGIESVALARGAFGHSGDTREAQGLLGKFTELLRKSPVTATNAEYEAVAQLATYKRGWTETMKNWKVGGLIPEFSVPGTMGMDDLKKIMGPELAGRAQSLIESARTPEDLARITENMGGAFAVTDPELAGRLRDAGMYDDVAGILRQSGDDGNKMAELMNDYLQKGGETLSSMGEMPLPKNTTEAAILNNFAKELQGVNFADPRAYDAWEKKLSAFHVWNESALAYARQAIDGVQDVTQQNQLRKELELLHDLGSGAQDLKSTSRNWRGALLDAQASGNLAAVRALGPEFANVQDITAAWDVYHGQIDGKWNTYFNEIGDSFLSMGDKAHKAAGKSGEAIRPTLDMVKGLAPATSAEMGLAYAEAQRALTSWDRYGFSGYKHYKNWLKKFISERADIFGEGHVALLSSQDFANPQALPAILEGLNQHALSKGLDPNRAMELAQDLGKVTVPDALLEAADDVPISARQINPQDITQNIAVQMQEKRALMMETLDHIVKGGAKAPELSQAQIEALQKFTGGLQGRLSQTRAIADRVATALQDATLFNYSDKYNFDTVMGFLSNFPFWHERNMVSWVKNAYYHPGPFAALLKLRKKLNEINSDKPEWWQDQINLKTAAGELHIPLLALIDPMNQIFGDKFHDPDMANTPIGAALSEATQYGPGLHSWISMAMMLDAFRRGERDEATSWMSYLGTPTRAFASLTASAGINNGAGITLEPWLWDKGPFVSSGSKYEARRIALALADMARDGLITPEQQADTMINQSGPIYEAALAKMKQDGTASVLASWLGGTGLKPRGDTELVMARMQEDRSALMAKYADMSPEEYAATAETRRLEWYTLRKKYADQGIDMDMVTAFSRDPQKRQESYVYSVFNRLPPNNTEYFAALGFDTEKIQTINKLLDQFYSDGLYPDKTGKGGMKELDREMLLNAMYQLGAVLALPDSATSEEWMIARMSYGAVAKRLEQQYGPEITSLQDDYYNTRDTQGKEAAEKFIEVHPELADYWRAKNEMVTGDPLLAKYYASMEQYERVLWADWRDKMETEYPGVTRMFDEYYALKETDPARAAKFFADNPAMKAYKTRRDIFTIGLRDKLEGFASTIEALNPEFGSMRGDINPADLPEGAKSVADLIASGARPMGEFDLPEDLPPRELEAQINLAYNSIPAGKQGMVYKMLKAAGGLDKTLTAFLNLRNEGTVAANMLKFGALNAALGNIMEQMGWKPLTEDSDLLAKFAAGAGGGGGGRVSSRMFSGKRRKKRAAVPDPAQDRKINEFLAGVQQSNPTYWQTLKQMSTMSQTDMASYLLTLKASNLVLYNWITAMGQQYDLAAVFEYLRRFK